MNPKQDFRNTPQFKGFSNLADTADFKAGVESCLLNFIETLPEESTIEHVRGAQRFANMLLKYHLTAEPVSRIATPNLNHKV